MAVTLCLGVEGVLIRKLHSESPDRQEFEMMPFAREFLSWAVNGFDCYWLRSQPKADLLGISRSMTIVNHLTLTDQSLRDD